MHRERCIVWSWDEEQSVFARWDIRIQRFVPETAKPFKIAPRYWLPEPLRPPGPNPGRTP